MSKKDKVKREKPSFKELFDNDNYKNGLRSAIICILAVALIVSINLFVKVLPTSVINIDMSKEKVYSISKDSKDLAASFDQDIDIYLVCSEGNVDKNVSIVLNKYADANKKIKVSTLDQALDMDKIVSLIGEVLTDDNTIIVKSGSKIQRIKPRNYQTATTFVLEDYLNSALKYVTGGTDMVVYELTGHDETELEKDAKAYMGLDGFGVEELNLMDERKIPENASAILINGPKKDLSVVEADLLVDYLENGGHVLLITDYMNNMYKNLETVTQYFDATLREGVIREKDEDRFMLENTTYILPSILVDGNKLITTGVDMVLAITSMGIILPEEDEVREGVDQQVLLKSSDTSAIIETNVLTGEMSTVPGPFNVGVSWEEKSKNGNNTRMVWFASKAISNIGVDDYVGGGNMTIFLNSLCWLAEENAVPSIHAKAVSTQFLSLTDATRSVLKVIMPAVVPAIVLIIGAIVMIRRKRR